MGLLKASFLGSDSYDRSNQKRDFLANNREAIVELDQTLIRNILETVVDGIIIADQNGKILVFNDAAERQFGYSRKDILGENLSRLMTETNSLSHQGYIDNYLETGERKIIGIGREVVGRRKNGTEFPIELAVSVVKGTEGPIFTGIIKDISQRRRMESERDALREQFHQAQKLEALGTMAGGMAHDFNNILNIILAHADVALMRIEEEENADDNIQNIIDASNRASDLVGKILAFSRGGSETRELCDFATIIGDGIRIIQPTLPSHVGLLHEENLVEGMVRCDPTQVYQILMNLVINAIHAVGDSAGQITCGVDRISPSEEGITGLSLEQNPENTSCATFGELNSRNYIRLSVRDNGEGMTRDVLDRAFQPFYTTKPVGSGSGLGLSAVQGIVAAHGGVLRVSSTLGAGSVFQIYIPEAFEKGEAAVVPSPVPDIQTQEPSERILLIDDEPALVSAMCELLQKKGYLVDGFSDPKKALSQFLDTPDAWNLVILDRMMPEISGFELAGKIRDVRTKLPILLYTGMVPEAIVPETMDALNRVVLKPISGFSLADVIRGLLNGEAPAGMAE